MTHNNSITLERTFALPLEKVWEAISSSEKLNKWYFKIPDFKLKDGAVFNFYEPGQKKKYHHQCQILEVKPKDTLKHTWSYPELSDKIAILTWHLIARGNATMVKLTHDNIQSFKDLGEDFSIENFDKGWNTILNISLNQFLENEKEDN